MTSGRAVPSISRKILPPHWLAFSLLLEMALDHWVPLAAWVPRPFNYAGAVLVAMGLALTLWAAALFRRAKTGVVPFSPSTSLVSGGPYAFTRNPMYLGMVCGLIGATVILGSSTPFLVPPAFAVLVTYLFILPEETHLEKAFGAPYLERKRNVRRWL